LSRVGLRRGRRARGGARSIEVLTRRELGHR
jgi:hypothetical protein